MAFCVCMYDTVYILYIIIYLSYQYIINIQNRNIFVILTLYHLMKYMIFFIENVRNL